MLQSEKDRAKAYQAIASFETAVNTYKAAQTAFTTLAWNPPLAGTVAAAVTLAGLARVAQINSQKPTFANGGIVPGNSTSGDRVDARVNSGEMINNHAQQANLYYGLGGDKSYTKSAQMELLQIAKGLRKAPRSREILP